MISFEETETSICVHTNICTSVSPRPRPPTPYPTPPEPHPTPQCGPVMSQIFYGAVVEANGLLFSWRYHSHLASHERDCVSQVKCSIGVDSVSERTRRTCLRDADDRTYIPSHNRKIQRVSVFEDWVRIRRTSPLLFRQSFCSPVTDHQQGKNSVVSTVVSFENVVEQLWIFLLACLPKRRWLQ